MSTIIIMAGGTASGKTSIAAEFAQKHKCLIIHHDRYYKDILFHQMQTLMNRTP